MVAARIPMTREGFERWLDTPVPAPDAIANPGAMYDGWLWDGRQADDEWNLDTEGTTPRSFFTERVEDSLSGQPTMTVLRHRDGALEAYLFHLGYDRWSVLTELLMFAAAGPYKSQ